jgi:uncharacterized membrane protein YhhN
MTLEWPSRLPFVSLAVILSAGLAIAAHYLRPPRRKLFFICKPLTTILILAAALLPGTFRTDPYAQAICLGLLFSLFGDIWLLLPGKYFLFGLISFLLAHLCYIFAFLTGASATGFPWTMLPLSLIGATILTYLWPGLSAGLKGAVCLYVAVIVVMASLATSRALVLFSTDTSSAAIGALLFMASDSILAIDRFRRPFRLSQAVILGSYFIGQLLIALSIGLRGFQ